jgi:hypothetical protein
MFSNTGREKFSLITGACIISVFAGFCLFVGCSNHGAGTLLVADPASRDGGWEGSDGFLTDSSALEVIGRDSRTDAESDCIDPSDCSDPACIDICEVCNDLIDNNGDELADCLDPICSEDLFCPEICGNFLDDDADGQMDCVDPECWEEPRCTESPVNFEEYVFSERVSYVTKMQFPSEGDDCCFDLDGDGTVDNNLYLALDLLPNYNPQYNVNEYINTGELTVLIEWLDGPDDLVAGGNTSFNVYRGAPVCPPGPSVEEVSHELAENPWSGGEGVFQVYDDNFDDFGPIIRVRDEPVVDNFLVAGPDMLDMTFPISELGLKLDLQMYDVQVEMFIKESISTDLTRDYVTESQTVEIDGEVVEVGGARIGGWVYGDDVMEVFNDGARVCNCARPDGFDVTEPLFRYGEVLRGDNVSYVVECLWSPLSETDDGYTCVEEEDSVMCPFLKDLCVLMEAVPLILDLDINGNGANEALSCGYYIDFVRGEINSSYTTEADSSCDTFCPLGAEPLSTGCGDCHCKVPELVYERTDIRMSPEDVLFSVNVIKREDTMFLEMRWIYDDPAVFSYPERVIAVAEIPELEIPSGLVYETLFFSEGHFDLSGPFSVPDPQWIELGFVQLHADLLVENAYISMSRVGDRLVGGVYLDMYSPGGDRPGNIIVAAPLDFPIP